MSKSLKLLTIVCCLTLIAVPALAYPGAAAQQAETTAPAAPATPFNKGLVIETVAASSYTYLHLEKEGQKFWAAIPAAEVAVGSVVELEAPIEMKNFQSQTLGRTFDMIIFSRGLVQN